MAIPIRFEQRLRAIQTRKESVLCVGLDPDLEKMPPHLTAKYSAADAIFAFNLAIIEATQTEACAYKLNFAFFERYGAAGWRALEATLKAIPSHALVIADAKRGDIGNSARMYAASVFESLACDAITVAPYMGQDAVAPFLQFAGKAAFVLGRTSNPGARDFQMLAVGSEKLYQHVAKQVVAWGQDSPGTAGLVVGATAPEVLADVRKRCPETPFLIPGVGAQGGTPNEVMAAAATPAGLVLVNSSRGILYASTGDDFAAAAAEVAATLRTALGTPPR